MRSILLYFLGVPIPIILVIALFTHHFLTASSRLRTRGQNVVTKQRLASENGKMGSATFPSSQ